MLLGQVPLESFISVQGVQTQMPLDKIGQIIRATGVTPELGQGFMEAEEKLSRQSSETCDEWF